MKILIELPTWLGDSVMVTPSIENLSNFYLNPEITIIGSSIAIEVIKNHPLVKKTYVLDKNYFRLYKCIRSLGKFDMFVSFRSSFRSKFIKIISQAREKHQYDSKSFVNNHQVEKYNKFINSITNKDSTPGELILHYQNTNTKSKHKLAGINPGASYGSAKQWYPEKFAKLAKDLACQYDILIFGGQAEKKIADQIEKLLIKEGVFNYQNLSNKTSISELINHISSLDLFITGDTGPMHIAAALKTPTVSIFGPTNDLETSQWMNHNNFIVKKNLDCQPCMKRLCPLKHHDCMKLIGVQDVLLASKNII
ncbi:glycosyltransferase family 9 protein [Candidatus Pseudothioglobus singularis]|nr:glycosyltransferase family 9 protein [Candidatus Pseudothioglobus singularis]